MNLSSAPDGAMRLECISGFAFTNAVSRDTSALLGQASASRRFVLSPQYAVTNR